MILEEVVVMNVPFEEALVSLKDALADQGFGTLTEIDLQATLRAKTGKETDRYVIVGACNPHLAGRALDIDPSIGVLLPCNVVLRQVDDQVIVEAMDPGLMPSITERADLQPVADDARALLGAALIELMN